MSQNDPMNLEMDIQNSGPETTVATTTITAVETNSSTQRSPAVVGHAETPKENPVEEVRNIIDSTISVDATKDDLNPNGATTANDTDSSSKQPTRVNGDTEVPNSASVEGEHDGVELAKVDNIYINDGRSEGAAPAMDNNSFSQLTALLKGHTESLVPTSVGGSNDETSPAVLDNVNAKTEESEDVVAPEPRSEGEEGAEWEIDSSPIQSSSSDISSDSYSVSDESDASNEEEYTLLDPAEQARMLMEGDGGSDDEGGKKGDKGTVGGQLRTKNEKPDDIVEKPDVKVTSDMAVEELGVVENTVENLVLIKAKTSGEYRVLETGSVLCLEDRTVIGVVAETLGRVQQPYYSVRFTNAAGIAEAGIAKDKKIYYVEQHSSYVFTQPLQAVKGSDASNLHDEEVGEDEMEFSDDEAEAEYKRRVKQDRRARKDARFGTNSGSVPGERNAGPRYNGSRQDVSMSYDDSKEIKYEDNDGDELYTPLARPPNLHELMGRGGMPVEGRTVHAGASRGRHGSRGGHDRGRGRGDRGRGSRSGRGDRGRERYGRGIGSQGQNGAGRPTHQNQYQNSYGAPLMSPAAPPTFSPQQTHQAPQTDTYSPQASSQPPFQHIYPPQSFPPPQQAFPQPHQSPQPGFSMLPANYHGQQQQRYSAQQQYQPPQPYSPPSHLPHKHQHPQPYQYHSYQQQLQQHPNQQPTPHPTQNPSLPPGAFLNPAFFRNQHQPQPQQIQPQQQSSLPSQYPMQNAWSPPQPQPQPHQPPSAALRHQYPSPAQTQWPAPTAYGTGPRHGHGQRQGVESAEGQGQEAAFRLAQEKLDILRGLRGGSGVGG